jgi:hypothetical protein
MRESLGTGIRVRISPIEVAICNEDNTGSNPSTTSYPESNKGSTISERNERGYTYTIKHLKYGYEKKITWQGVLDQRRSRQNARIAEQIRDWKIIQNEVDDQIC